MPPATRPDPAPGPAPGPAPELPIAELRAAALDGELYELDGAWLPLDEFDRPALRAAVIARRFSARLIAERRSAAWVLGALDAPPPRHELCADAEARTRIWSTGALVREVVLDPEDVVRIGALTVTTPVRTVVDLARVEPEFGEPERAIARRLLALAGADAALCRALIDRRRNLPNKREAWARILSL
ncbi:MAG: type IV toxin-antitoxin system AbiEi family antitoxin [Microbacteriaceae bacterium]